VRDSLVAARKDRIMLETDCPYLTPEPHRGKTNYPKYVKHIYKFVEDLTGVNEEQIDSNAKEFFNV
jgi:TatD DNase family protein